MLMSIQFFLKGLSYYQEEDLKELSYVRRVKNTKRRYIMHPNAYVYLANGTKKQIYQATNKELETASLIKCSEKWVTNYFMVGDDQKNLRENGKETKKTWKNVLERMILASTIKPQLQIVVGYQNYLLQMKNFQDIEVLEQMLKSKYVVDWIKLKREKMGRQFDVFQQNRTKGDVPLKKRVQYQRETLVEEFKDLTQRKKYDPSLKAPNVHWGQMKLFVSEVEFLSMYPDTQLVVYAGAAGGHHIPLLSAMFPNKYFVLFDPADFAIRPSKRIVIRNEFFTEATMKEFKNDEFLFITDIRSSRSKDDVKYEETILEDMERQRKWIEEMVPRASMIKFRATFPGMKFKPGSKLDRISKEGKQEYLDGILLLQAFAKETSTEMRLIVDRELHRRGSKFITKNYDIHLIEEKMFYFNQVYRPAQHLGVDLVWGVNFDIAKFYVTMIRSDAIRKTKNEEKEGKILAILGYFEKEISNQYRIIDKLK